MKLKKYKNQAGFGHLILVVMVVAVVGTIGVVGYRVKTHYSANSVGTNSTATVRKKSTVSTNATAATTVSPAGTPSSSSGTASASAPKTSNSSSTAASSTPASPPTSSNSSSTQSQSCTAPGLKFYTALGCVPAASLYNVKSPPPASKQPDMSVYACLQNLGNNTAYVQVLGTLSYSVDSPQSWYVDLDLSSSASADNLISTKSTTYGYYNNAWQVGGSTLQQSAIRTDNFNPGVISDFYIWAYGSYGGAVLAGINTHPNVQSLQSCS